ncbi:MAG: hypothetical protein ACJAVM_003001 [Sulfitobacter sp.]|jgi:hypothetical protein
MGGVAGVSMPVGGARFNHYSWHLSDFVYRGVPKLPDFWAAHHIRSQETLIGYFTARPLDTVYACAL